MAGVCEWMDWSRRVCCVSLQLRVRMRCDAMRCDAMWMCGDARRRSIGVVQQRTQRDDAIRRIGIDRRDCIAFPRHTQQRRYSAHTNRCNWSAPHSHDQVSTTSEHASRAGCCQDDTRIARIPSRSMHTSNGMCLNSRRHTLSSKFQDECGRANSKLLRYRDCSLELASCS
jgi:hypothetical protein